MSDFDRYVAEHHIPEEEWRRRSPGGSQSTGGSMLRYEKVEPGDEQVLDEREQRELDAVPSALDPAGEDGAPRPERKKSVFRASGRASVINARTAR
jgi:hypothetical protein